MTVSLDKIKVNGDECLSGSFISSVDNRNEISFSRESERIIINFGFEEKENKKISTRFDGGGKDKDLIVSLEFPLLKDDNQGILRPIQIASFDNGDTISLQIWVNRIAKPYAVINYSIYIKNAHK